MSSGGRAAMQGSLWSESRSNWFVEEEVAAVVACPVCTFIQDEAFGEGRESCAMCGSALAAGAAVPSALPTPPRAPIERGDSQSPIRPEVAQLVERAKMRQSSSATPDRQSLRASLQASFGDEVGSRALLRRSLQPRVPLGDRVVRTGDLRAVDASPSRASSSSGGSDDDSHSETPLLLNLLNVHAGSAWESIVGGKAGSLARLLALSRAGDEDEARGVHGTLDRLRHVNVCVPAAAAVTTHAYLAHTAEWSDEFRALLARRDGQPPSAAQLASVRERIVAKPLAGDVEALIGRFLAALPADVASVAVRSSSTQEDEAGASWAGQYETYLNVPRTVADVGAAVKRCWASIWQPRSIEYRCRLERGAAAARPVPAMAVVIQRQLDPAAAGVLFTIDPVTGDEDTFVVESVWGLGEGVVGGEITPHNFHVRWLDGEVTSSRVTPQQRKYAFRTAATGDDAQQWVQLTDTAPHERDAPSLSAEQLRALCRVAATVASVTGHPQDLEWAVQDGVVYLLQARNITAYRIATPIAYFDLRFQNESLFTLSKCSAAYLDMIRRSIRTRRLPLSPDGHAACPLLLTRFQHVYIDRRFFAAYGACLDQHSRQQHFDVAATVASYAPLFDDVLGRSRALAPLYERIARRGFDGFTDAELTDAFHQLSAYQAAVDCSSYTIGEIVEQCQQKVDEYINWLSTDELPLRIDNLVRGVNVDSEAKKSSDLLAQAAAALATDPLVRQHYAGETSTSPPHPAVVAFIDSYVQRFFYMSAADEDISLPRFREDPSTPLGILENLLRARCSDASSASSSSPLPPPPPPPPSVAPIEHYQPVPIVVDDEDEAYGFELLKLLSRLEEMNDVDAQQLDWHRGYVGTLVDQGLRHCLHLKETVHTLYVWSGYFLRRVIVELVQRAGLDCGTYRKGSTISEQHPIWTLTADELAALFPRTDSLRSLHYDTRVLQQRATKAAFFRNFARPAELQQGRVKVKPPKPTGCAGEKYVVGTGASAGTVTGTARVILSLNDAHHLRKGDVLVTRYTDPSWTGLFSLISAVVIEDGGTLSHAAVVARELGICAVVQATNATKIFASGDTIFVDGHAGVVTSSLPSANVE